MLTPTDSSTAPTVQSSNPSQAPAFHSFLNIVLPTKIREKTRNFREGDICFVWCRSCVSWASIQLSSFLDETIRVIRAISGSKLLAYLVGVIRGTRVSHP